MTLIRWMPMRTGQRTGCVAATTFDRLFDRADHRLAAAPGDLAPLFAPPVDIEETAEEFVLRARSAGRDRRRTSR